MCRVCLRTHQSRSQLTAFAFISTALFVAVPQAKLEEAEAQAEALAASNRSSDRSEQLEADIARLLEERAELQAAQQETLRSAEQARTQLQEEHDEAVRALEAAISEAMDAVEMKEAELAELSQKRDELCAEVRRAGDEAKVAADRLAAAEGCVRELEQRLTEADEEVRLITYWHCVCERLLLLLPRTWYVFRVYS